jgi:hypothetical protein
MPESDASVEWQGSPGRRGTLTILWSCLITVLACTWSIQHLNLPGPRDGPWAQMLRKCKWAAITLLFPEFIMAHAIYELAMAIHDLGKLEARRARTVEPWWLKLAQGKQVKPPAWLTRVLCCCCLGREAQVELHRKEEGQAEQHPWTLTHCYLANMGGFSVDVREEVAGSAAGRSTKLTCSPAPFSWAQHRPMTAGQLAERWTRDTMLQVSEEEIMDKSKTDYLSKAVAVVQIAQLLLSIIVRRARNLAVSQLEVLTLAFAVCGILTYAAYWYKP